MAKKKKSASGFFGSKKKKKKLTKIQIREAKEATFTRIRIFTAILGTVLVAAAICAGFFYMEKYVHKVSPIARKTGLLEFPKDNIPEWFNEELASLMREAAGGKVFDLDESSAKMVAEKLSKLAWCHGLKVQTTKDSLRVTANYRKPVAMIKLGSKKYCIAVKSRQDKQLVAMKHLNIAKLPIVEITGSKLGSIENVGLQEDMAAAVNLIILLSSMDDEVKTPTPLLDEIASIDVSNFDGRKKQTLSDSHINLYARDGTPIYWGNELGKTTGQIEATDKEKLSSLYRFFLENGKNTLLDRNVNFIDPRRPR